MPSERRKEVGVVGEGGGVVGGGEEERKEGGGSDVCKPQIYFPFHIEVTRPLFMHCHKNATTVLA